MASPNTDGTIQNAEHVEESKEETQTPDEISFIEQVEKALTKAKSEDKILMVLCETERNTEYIAIWNHPTVVESVRNHAICLLIHNETLAFTQFTALYPVIAFPTMYCINPQNGQVLQCKYKDQITLDSVIGSIKTSVDLIFQQAHDETLAKNRRQLQNQDISQQQTPSSNRNNPTPSIQEMDEPSQDSSTSSSSPTDPKKKTTSALTKLQQIREKARAQKTKSQSNNEKISTPPPRTPSSTKSATKPATKRPKAVKDQKAKPQPAKSNNYNFNDDKLDAIEYMEITRRNKLRKRKKKVETKFKKPPRKPLKTQKKTEDDAVASTPISSAAKKGTQGGIGKRARLAFRINNEMDVERYFNAEDTLMDVMRYIMNETGVNDFVFVSQYPPINIDSIYLDHKMSAQMGLFTKNNDEKSNESMYDEIQSTLQKTLYELNMVPSCRVFVQPKFKGHPRSNADWNNNIVLRFGYFVMDLIKIILHYGYNGLWFVLCLLWEIINAPLNMLGITKRKESESRSNEARSVKQSVRNNPRKSKLPPYKKNKRLMGKKGRINHKEKDEERNRLNNGNSTMFGGDGNQ